MTCDRSAASSSTSRILAPAACRGRVGVGRDARAGLGQRDRQLQAQPLVVAGADLDRKPDASGRGARRWRSATASRLRRLPSPVLPVLVGEGERAAGRFGEAVVGVPHADHRLARGLVDGDLDVAVLGGRQEVLDHAFEQVAEALARRRTRAATRARRLTWMGIPFSRPAASWLSASLPHQRRQVDGVDVDLAAARLDGRRDPRCHRPAPAPTDRCGGSPRRTGAASSTAARRPPRRAAGRA